LRAFPIDPVLAAWLNSSPARTAEIRVSITAGSLSLEGTTMPADWIRRQNSSRHQLALSWTIKN